MKFEQLPNIRKNHTEELATGFRSLSKENLDTQVFEDLENDLQGAGFELADNNAVFQILNDNSLFCRSENFSNIVNLLLDHEEINLVNTDNAANSCVMASAEGYKTAMVEGFSGKDVNHATKVVISFSGNNLEAHDPIPPNSELWRLKPKTAAVSVASSGKITFADLRMVSFRFPIHLYPENFLSEDEKERLEEDEIKFIVRHYIPKKLPT